MCSVASMKTEVEMFPAFIQALKNWPPADKGRKIKLAYKDSHVYGDLSVDIGVADSKTPFVCGARVEFKLKPTSDPFDDRGTAGKNAEEPEYKSVSRQKMLEESVYDTAVEWLQHEATMLKELGLDNSSLRQPDLRRLMWEWHAKLKDRLAEEIRNIAETEKKTFHNDQWPEPQCAPFTLPFSRQSRAPLAEGMKTTRALITVGKAVENEYMAQEQQYYSQVISRIWVIVIFWSGDWWQARRMQDGEAWTTCISSLLCP